MIKELYKERKYNDIVNLYKENKDLINSIDDEELYCLLASLFKMDEIEIMKFVYLMLQYNDKETIENDLFIFLECIKKHELLYIKNYINDSKVLKEYYNDDCITEDGANYSFIISNYINEIDKVCSLLIYSLLLKIDNDDNIAYLYYEMVDTIFEISMNIELTEKLNQIGNMIFTLNL